MTNWEQKIPNENERKCGKKNGKKVIKKIIGIILTLNSQIVSYGKKRIQTKANVFFLHKKKIVKIWKRKLKLGNFLAQYRIFAYQPNWFYLGFIRFGFFPFLIDTELLVIHQ